MAIVKEPLVHFAVAGAVLFGLYAWLDRGEEPTDTGVAGVEITEGDVRWIAETWSNQWLRQPSPDELRRMVADLVDEEMLAREAVEMGLDKDDTVIRRRLAQKLTFLVQDTAHLVEPSDAELRAFHASHGDLFETGARVSFAQVFFSPSRRGDAGADARAMLVSLRGDESEGADRGDPLLVDGDFRDLDRNAVVATFGPAFADAVFALAPGVWSGPITSAYGQHLVFVSATIPSESIPFEAARDAVAEAWRHEKDMAAWQGFMALLRAKYPVRMEDSVRALLEDRTAAEAAQ